MRNYEGGMRNYDLGIRNKKQRTRNKEQKNHPALVERKNKKRFKRPVAERISSCVLCLPLYVGLREEVQVNIAEIVNG